MVSNLQVSVGERAPQGRVDVLVGEVARNAVAPRDDRSRDRRQDDEDAERDDRNGECAGVGPSPNPRAGESRDRHSLENAVDGDQVPAALPAFEKHDDSRASTVEFPTWFTETMTCVAVLPQYGLFAVTSVMTV